MALLLLALSTARAEDAPPRKNINEATLKDLTDVKGIGKVFAQRILSARADRGGFTSMKQLAEIKGVGKVKLARLICGFQVVDEGPLECTLPPEGELPGGETVNINTANAKELTKLPGVGKKRAEDIFQYRQENGLFKSIWDLTNIKGFGKVMVQKFESMVRVLVDINTARAAEFESLGFANGDTIIEYRNQLGAFSKVEDLLDVPGIDTRVYEALDGFLVVTQDQDAQPSDAGDDSD